MSWKQPIPTDLEARCGNNTSAFVLMMVLILKAANKPQAVSLGKHTIQLARGQTIFGRTAFAKYLGKSDKTAERTLQLLERLGFVRLINPSNQINGQGKTLSKKRPFTVVELLNYDSLVSFDQESDHRTSNERPTPDHTQERKNKDYEDPQGSPSSSTIHVEPLGSDELLSYWEKTMAPISRNRYKQIAALRSMADEHGTDLTKLMIRGCAAALADRFAPGNVKCSTPAELNVKWDVVTVWLKSRHEQDRSRVTVV